MKQIGRIALGAVIVGTALAVIFYRFTAIQITSGLASLFALIGLLVSWILFWLVGIVFEHRGNPPLGHGKLSETKSSESRSRPHIKVEAKKSNPGRHK
jgi:prepilin signal peptidase PulO-like enzyme (type II secretory pathway)